VWAVLEILGYRQLTVWWRLRGVVSYLRGKKSWGKTTRAGFNPAEDQDAPVTDGDEAADARRMDRAGPAIRAGAQPGTAAIGGSGRRHRRYQTAGMRTGGTSGGADTGEALLMGRPSMLGDRHHFAS